MITGRIVLSKQDYILELSVSGHSVQRGRGSIPCAAVSVLTGTFARLLEQEKGIEIQGGAERPGSLVLKTVKVIPEKQEKYLGFCRFLLEGLLETREEFPGEFLLEIITRD